MVRGLYTSASGMLVFWNIHNVISNNLANVDTAGFKRDVVTVQSYPTVPISRIQDTYFETYFRKIDLRPHIGYLGVGAIVDKTHTIHTEGKYKQTDNPFDVAIKGDGFFTIQTPNGIRYTRDGSFTKNSNGELVTLRGDIVLGEEGVIIVGGGKIQFGEDGSVYVDGNFVGRLRITNFPDISHLEKIGDNLFNAQPGAGIPFTPLNFEILQGYIETSNVNSVREMVEMISALRAYEASQRMITAQDQTLDKVINEVGKAV